MAKLFANGGDLDWTPRSAASELGLHCLPFTLLWVSQLQWVNALLRMSFTKSVLMFSTVSNKNMKKKNFFIFIFLFSFLWGISIDPRKEGWTVKSTMTVLLFLSWMQMVETLIGHQVLQHLSWVCTVCHLPFYGSPNYNGLMHFLGWVSQKVF